MTGCEAGRCNKSSTLSGILIVISSLYIYIYIIYIYYIYYIRIIYIYILYIFSKTVYILGHLTKYLLIYINANITANAVLLNN